jgi:hypothetical protein
MTPYFLPDINAESTVSLNETAGATFSHSISSFIFYFKFLYIISHENPDNNLESPCMRITNRNHILVDYTVINLKELLGNYSETDQSWNTVKPFLIGIKSYFIGEGFVAK